MKTYVRALVVACVLFGGLTVVSGQQSMSRTASAWSVVQTSTLYYNSQRCGKYGTAFQVTSNITRWFRSASNMKLSKATLRMGGVAKRCSDGSAWRANNNQDFYPCFGCRGATSEYTPTYIHSVNWPYLLDLNFASTPMPLGACVTGFVVDHTGRSRGKLQTGNNLFPLAVGCA